MEELSNNALTTLDRVKVRLGIALDNIEFDDQLTSFINEASSFIEDYIGRDLGKRNKVEVAYGSADNILILKNRPVITINSIKQSDDVIEDYEATEDDLQNGIVYRDKGWTKLVYSVGLTGDQFGNRRYYEIDYDYGYILPKDATGEIPQTLPRSLESVAISLVAVKFKENQRDSYGLRELKQGRLTYKFSTNSLSEQDLQILNRYRKRVGVW